MYVHVQSCLWSTAIRMHNQSGGLLHDESGIDGVAQRSSACVFRHEPRAVP